MVSNANDSKRTQESVRIGQGHYETLVNSIDGIVYEVDAQTFKVEYVSKQAATMLGYSVAQWLGEPEFWENHIHPDDRANTVEQCKQAVVGKTSSQFEYRMIAADGRVVWLRDSLTVTEDDQTIKLRGLMVDITSSRRAETEREVLSQIIQGVTTTSNVDELLQLIHQSLKKVLYAENCFVSLYDKKTGLFQKRFCVDTFDTSSSPQKMLKSCSAYVFRTGQPLLMTQIMLNEMLERGDVELIGERAPSWLGVPLTTPTECIGVLVVQHYEEEDIYSERDVTFLSSVGGQVALAIERKRREDELKQRERQLGEAQRMARLGSWVWNITTNQVMWSAELYRICGVDPEEFGATYDAFLNLVHPDDRDMLKGVIHQTLQNHQAADYEFRFIPPHGRELVMQGHGEVILNTDGLPVRMIGTAQDITDKRRSEQSLRESEGRFRELFDDAPVGYHELDFEGRITCVNKTELSMLGYNVEEMVGHYSWDFVTNRKTSRKAIKEKLSGSRPLRPVKRTFKRKDGTLLRVQLNDRLLKEDNGRIVGIRTTLQDITERERAEKALHEADQRAIKEYEGLLGRIASLAQALGTAHDLKRIFRALLDFALISTPSNGLFVSLYDPALDLRTAAYAWSDGEEVDVLSLPPMEMTGSPHSRAVATGEVVITDDYQTAIAGLPTVDVGNAEQPRLPRSSLAAPMTIMGRLMGAVEVQSTELAAFNQEHATAMHMAANLVGAAIENVQLLERERESEARYRDLVENAKDIIYTHDMAGRYTSVNRAAEQITGYTRDEVLTMNISDIVAPKSLDEARRMTVLKLGGNDLTVYDLEVITKDKRRVAVEVSSRLILKEGLPLGVQGIARDVSERKQLEEQLRQSQKLESVGQLAGGIAHDFNNLLTAIGGYSELMLRHLGESDPLRRNATEIKNASDRAASLTRQLLAFSRKQVLEPRVLDLNDVVADVDKLLRRLIGEDIELITVRNPGLGRVKADPSQLSQVVINLAVNSRDAMPNGGKLTIETKNVCLDEIYARAHAPLHPGQYVMLAVADTGEGMDLETQKHIFEPFFTTKEVGKGTGLGLSMAYGVVKQSGGYIWADSEIGRGTTFTIYLPPVDEEIEEIEPRIPELPKGAETILLVEDEDMVREVVREFLEIDGYTVLEAAQGEEALQICDRYKNDIDMLITDVVMPKMSGRELVERLSGNFPDLKVLYISGYTDDAIVRHGILEPGTNFLHKPFTPDDLARKVHEVLSAAS